MAIDTQISDRARRSLSHGGGIEGILFTLIAGAGIGLVVVLLIVGLRTAESNATRDTREGRTAVRGDQASELGTN